MHAYEIKVNNSALPSSLNMNSARCGLESIYVPVEPQVCWLLSPSRKALQYVSMKLSFRSSGVQTITLSMIAVYVYRNYQIIFCV